MHSTDASYERKTSSNREASAAFYKRKQNSLVQRIIFNSNSRPLKLRRFTHTRVYLMFILACIFALLVYFLLLL